MTHLSSEQASTGIDSAIDLVSRESERVIIDRAGAPIAALIPYADLEWLEEIEDLLDAREGERILAEVKAGRMGTISLEELECRLNASKG